MIERIEHLAIVVTLSAAVLASGAKLIQAAEGTVLEQSYNVAVEKFEKEANCKIEQVINIEQLELNLRQTQNAIDLIK